MLAILAVSTTKAGPAENAEILCEANGQGNDDGEKCTTDVCIQGSCAHLPTNGGSSASDERQNHGSSDLEHTSVSAEPRGCQESSSTRQQIKGHAEAPAPACPELIFSPLLPLDILGTILSDSILILAAEVQAIADLLWALETFSMSVAGGIFDISRNVTMPEFLRVDPISCELYASAYSTMGLFLVQGWLALVIAYEVSILALRVVSFAAGLVIVVLSACLLNLYYRRAKKEDRESAGAMLLFSPYIWPVLSRYCPLLPAMAFLDCLYWYDNADHTVIPRAGWVRFHIKWLFTCFSVWHACRCIVSGIGIGKTPDLESGIYDLFQFGIYLLGFTILNDTETRRAERPQRQPQSEEYILPLRFFALVDLSGLALVSAALGWCGFIKPLCLLAVVFKLVMFDHMPAIEHQLGAWKVAGRQARGHVRGLLKQMTKTLTDAAAENCFNDARKGQSEKADGREPSQLSQNPQQMPPAGPPPAYAELVYADVALQPDACGGMPGNPPAYAEAVASAPAQTFGDDDRTGH
jgi:hypothetical protein